MRRLLKVLAIVVGLILLVGVSFGAGVFVSSANLLTPCVLRTSDQPQQFAIFWQAWNLVQKNFVDRTALDPTQLVYGATRGMVEALGDTGHSGFLTPQERAQQATSISGSFSGVGAQMDIKNGMPVMTPLDGSPAIKAGIKAGDILLRVNGSDVTTNTLSVIVQKVRGPAGSKVDLTILRPTDNKVYNFTITRSAINIPAATWTMVPGTQIALIRLSQFSENADRDVTAALQGAKQAKATGIIFDVRNNPGGLLDQATKVTSHFIKEGNVLLVADAQGNRTPSPVQPSNEPTDLPLVVLTNPGTASAAEIFAGAVQDYKRGQVVGETTFGTGTVLEPFPLADGSELLLGVKQWLTPNGRTIRKQGIKPDIEVKLPLGSQLLTPTDVKELTPTEREKNADAQFLKALSLFKTTP